MWFQSRVSRVANDRLRHPYRQQTIRKYRDAARRIYLNSTTQNGLRTSNPLRLR